MPPRDASQRQWRGGDKATMGQVMERWLEHGNGVMELLRPHTEGEDMDKGFALPPRGKCFRLCSPWSAARRRRHFRGTARRGGERPVASGAAIQIDFFRSPAAKLPFPSRTWKKMARMALVRSHGRSRNTTVTSEGGGWGFSGHGWRKEIVGVRRHGGRV